jgi:cytidine deaminase
VLTEHQTISLLHAAEAARQHAYCPYSGFAVGAAVLTAHGNVYGGCNVENASYGLTICAERNAVAAAVADGLTPGGLQAVALVAGPRESRTVQRSFAVVPCGACLQVLAEFAAPDCLVLCRAADAAEPAVHRLRELLPAAFRLGTR